MGFCHAESDPSWGCCQAGRVNRKVGGSGPGGWRPPLPVREGERRPGAVSNADPTDDGFHADAGWDARRGETDGR